jgi:hypothetical protein
MYRDEASLRKSRFGSTILQANEYSTLLTTCTWRSHSRMGPASVFRVKPQNPKMTVCLASWRNIAITLKTPSSQHTTALLGANRRRKLALWPVNSSYGQNA